MHISIFYTISYFALLSGIFFLHKSDKKQNALVWIALSVMTSFAVQAAGAGLFYLTKIPVGILSGGIVNAAAAAVLWFMIIRRGSQRYYFDKFDAASFFVLFLVAGFIYSKRFALGHDISFASIDSATTYDLIRTIVMEHKVLTNMFFSMVNSAYPMEAALPITGEFYIFRTFLLWETGYFFMSGIFFYILVKRLLSTKGLKLFGLAAAVIYMLGYPLYALIFGFSYFSLSISVVAYIIYSAMLYIEGEISRVNSCIMLNLGLLGLFLCYMMFVPAVFFGILIALAIYLLREHELFSLKTIKTGLAVFLAPSIVGLLITAANLSFISHSTVVSGASDGSHGIAMDGGCYNDMYSNFIILLPMAVTGFIISMKKLMKKDTRKDAPASHIVIPSVTVTMLVFAVILFINAMKGYVSVYYYVKNNNIFALLAWCLVIIAASEMWSRAKEIFIAFIMIFSMLIVMVVSGADAKIDEKNNRFLRVGAESFIDIYHFNNEFVKYSGDINSDDIELMKYAKENLVVKEDVTETLVVGGFLYTHWFAKLTNNSRIAQVNASSELQEINPADYKYLCVQNTAVYDENKDLFDNIGNVIYSNTRGKIIEMR